MNDLKKIWLSYSINKDTPLYGGQTENFNMFKTSSIKVFGFDSISISSWQDRDMGKVSHKVFLNPKNPILILEDMDLNNLSINSNLKEIFISPLRIEKCDGLPCTIIGTICE